MKWTYLGCIGEKLREQRGGSVESPGGKCGGALARLVIQGRRKGWSQEIFRKENVAVGEEDRVKNGSWMRELGE